MIAPQDLRLGNLVEYDGKIFKVKEIRNYIIVCDRGKGNVDFTVNEISPLELTEDWLLKLGFEKKEDQKYYHEKYDRTWVKIETCIVKWYGNAIGGLVMIDYVHQLQNCFNVFTGEELTIKEQK